MYLVLPTDLTIYLPVLNEPQWGRVWRTSRKRLCLSFRNTSH